MPIYMKFEGVEGDVTAAGHEKWIDLESLSWGSSRNVTTASAGAQRTKSAVQVREVTITKQRDHSSGKLWSEHLKGDPPRKVEFVWVTTSQGGVQIYQKIELENVLISSFSASGHSQAMPLEQLSLNFTSITGSFYDMSSEGTKTSKPFTQSYNLDQHK